MVMDYIKKAGRYTAIIGLFATASLVAAQVAAPTKVRLWSSTIPVETEDGHLDVPVYNYFNLPHLLCSGYVRKAGEDLFGKKFKPCAAENRIYNDKDVNWVGNSSLEELVQKGVLESGMAIGVYNPNSSFNNVKDEKGKLVTYTHIVLYLGKRKSDGALLVAEQNGNQIMVKSIQEMEEAGLEPLVVTNP